MKARVRCIRIDLQGGGVLRAMQGEIEGAGPELAEAVGDLVALMMGRRDEPKPIPRAPIEPARRCCQRAVRDRPEGATSATCPKCRATWNNLEPAPLSTRRRREGLPS